MIQNLFTNKKKKGVLNAFRKEEVNLISFEDLKKFKEGERIDIIEERPNAIVCTRLPSKDSISSLSFRVEMKKGEKWNPHYHDCLEVLVIYKGSCKDLRSSITADKGNQMIIKPGVIHEIECTSDEAIFYVEFNKVEK